MRYERMRALRLAVVFGAAFVLPCSLAFGEPVRFDSMRRGRREITFATGYGVNHRIPESTRDRLHFNVVRLRYAWYTSPRTQLAYDFSAGTVVSGSDNAWLTLVWGYRRMFMARGRTALGYDLGFGLVNLKDKVSELGTRTNFTEQLGLAFNYAIDESAALTLQLEFNHISNAGINLPNVGLNNSNVSLGYSWYY